ncbi:bifunctional metallophosphatase/5'-nucleotidase [Candidatus Neomarinimicrobiota bacterium]
MNFFKKRCFIAFLIIIVCGCSKNKTNNYHSSNTDNNTTQSSIEDPRNITILYTNDEHGWMEKSQYSNGAANMMGLWCDQEEYDGDDSFLILSGSDNWLGSPISTMFKGESTVDVMNAMEYDAAVIGNHEFEFGIQNLYHRIIQAKFPYLSANIRKKTTGEIPCFAIPYIVKEINDVMVGIIGLTPVSTPNNTITEYVKDYEFIDYLTALEETVPQAKSDGADLLIVIAHTSYYNLIDLAPELINMGIIVAGGGHCHRKITPQVIKNNNGKLAVIQANPYLGSYAKVEISYDIIEKKVIALNVSGSLNEEITPDSNVESVVTYWKDQTNRKLSEISTKIDPKIKVG